MPRFISFTSDFSLQDDSVGTVKGVIWRIAPQAVIVDILHAVPDYDIMRGALCLANTLPYMPVGVHLAVVDPGVGTARRPVAITTARGDHLVGPDNGLLPWAADALDGAVAAHLLANEQYMLSPRSTTFHGRDIFGPAAAHLALGVPAEEFGPSVDVASLVTLNLPRAAWAEDGLHAEVLYVDHYGNLRLNARRADLLSQGVEPGAIMRVRIGEHRLLCAWRETFGATESGNAVLVEDSYWRLCLALNKASAAQAYGAAVGTGVILSPA